MMANPKWRGCPVMPVLAKFRPDLLTAAEAVGDNVGHAIAFIEEHKLCVERPGYNDTISKRGKHNIAKEVIRTLRNGS